MSSPDIADNEYLIQAYNNFPKSITYIEELIRLLNDDGLFNELTYRKEVITKIEQFLKTIQWI